MMRSVPPPTVPKPVMVVVPLTARNKNAAPVAAMAVVAALAMALPWLPIARLTIAARPRIALLIPLDAPKPGVRIDRVPDRLAGLRRLGQHVPVIAHALHRGACRPVQAYLVFPCAPMPDRDRALPAVFEIAPETPLIVSRVPAIGKSDFHGSISSRFRNGRLIIGLRLQDDILPIRPHS